MTHDPLCPWYPNTHEDVSCRDAETLVIICDVIAIVREEEGTAFNAAFERAANYALEQVRKGQIDIIGHCIEAIEAERNEWEKRASEADEDSLIGRRYRDYADAHAHDIRCLRQLRALLEGKKP